MASNLSEVITVSLLGLATTSSVLAGAAIGLYLPLSKRFLACILAFAAGALISALAIDLAYDGVQQMHAAGFGIRAAWAFIGGGFATGAIIYYVASLYLEGKGAAVRYGSQFREYARQRKQKEAAAVIALLSKCDLMRHLPPDEIEQILPCIRDRRLERGEVLFRAGDPGDALYIVARGAVEILAAPCQEGSEAEPIATLAEGKAFGEMALLTEGFRTASVRAAAETDLLEIGKAEFDHLIKTDRHFAAAVERMSHQRAIENLGSGGANSATWAKVASSSLDSLGRREANKMLAEAAHGSGLAIVLGNILDTIPGCLVIGAKFTGLEGLSLTLILGMFLGGIPEAAASAHMLQKAGFRPKVIFALWSTVLLAGVVAAAAGKLFIGSSGSLVAIFSAAVAGGAVLAVVAHAMIPEAIDEGGSVVVLPTVAGFLFALYLAMSESFG